MPELTPRDDARSLVDRPQRFGIAPTWWFWNKRENWRLVGFGFGLLAVVTNVILSFFSLRPLVAGLIGAGVIWLGVGVLEKYLRHQVMKRRALAEGGDSARPEALGRGQSSERE